MPLYRVYPEVGTWDNDEEFILVSASSEDEAKQKLLDAFKAELDDPYSELVAEANKALANKEPVAGKVVINKIEESLALYGRYVEVSAVGFEDLFGEEEVSMVLDGEGLAMWDDLAENLGIRRQVLPPAKGFGLGNQPLKNTNKKKTKARRR